MLFGSRLRPGLGAQSGPCAPAAVSAASTASTASIWRLRSLSLVLVCLLAVANAACGSSDSGDRDSAAKPAASAPAKAKPAAGTSAPPAKPAAPVSKVDPKATHALVLGLAKFPAPQPGKPPVPEPATLEFLIPTLEGEWKVVTLEDSQSNVFHKAMVYPGPDGPLLLSAAGSQATLKLWQKKDGELVSQTLWEKDFGGKFSRMRDVEVADIMGDGQASIAVATHDQGVVAIVKPDGKGGFSVEELDSEPDTFVHEIEVGDVNGDGVLEVYATPSEPNRLDGRAQSGAVVRYVPAKGEGRVVVADLGDLHAKEILVQDVDGDGTDELYVSVEGHMNPKTKALDHGVEIRRYDADTDPTKGVVVAELDDRLSRFLTAADVDGDGKLEMVVAAFSSGLWLLRPSESGLWTKESIDRDSGGFEHAAILKALDGDGRAELYVASDNDKEVRRYVWRDGSFERSTIYRRKGGGSVFTWNIMPVPVELVPES